MVTVTFEAMNFMARHIGSCRVGRERGGFLFGRPGAITTVEATDNMADDPTCEFDVDHLVMFDAIEAAEASGLEFLGTYHCHPNGRTEMSAADVRLANDTGYLMIAAVGEYWGWKLYDGAAGGEIGWAIVPPDISHYIH